jgi:hypothetical protein
MWRRSLFWLVPAALAAACAQAQTSRPDGLSTEIGEILAELSSISGLKPLAKVECDHISRERVREFLEQRVREEVKPEELRAEEAALKKFGFAPPDFDLRKTTLDLLAEQVAAFYDYRKKKLFVIDSVEGPVQRSVLVHELAHALADQHFHLEKYMDRANKNDDVALARLAVMEGQATWLMSEDLTRRTGQSLKDSPVLVKLMSNLNEASAAQFPVYQGAPLYLRETLLFPYTQGMLFQHALIEKMGQAAFAEVFRRPPESTQQVLHPEMYLERVKPVRPALPEFKTERDCRRLTDGEVGELDHAILLRQYAGEKDSAAVAPQWRGGYFRLFESKTGKRTVLVYASEWSGPEPARQYFNLYQKVLAGKWKTFEADSHGDGILAGRGDDGYFLLRLDGARVTSVEGLESPEEALQR